MKHNHKEECKHEKLKYCKECDVVECECGREWGKKNEKGWSASYITSPCYRCGADFALYGKDYTALGFIKGQPTEQEDFFDTYYEEDY